MSIYACKCGCGFDSPDPRVVDTVEAIKKLIPSTKVNSGCRCEKHNLDVGGKPNSAHLSGKAVDVAAGGSWNRYVILNILFGRGVRRIGLAKSFIHFDFDEEKPQDVCFDY